MTEYCECETNLIRYFDGFPRFQHPSPLSPIPNTKGGFWNAIGLLYIRGRYALTSTARFDGFCSHWYSTLHQFQSRQSVSDHLPNSNSFRWHRWNADQLQQLLPFMFKSIQLKSFFPSSFWNSGATQSNRALPLCALRVPIFPSLSTILTEVLRGFPFCLLFPWVAEQGCY
jgi:hypothetical protein